jgi:putative transposase
LATERKISISAVCCQLGYTKQAYYKSRSIQKRKVCDQRLIRQKVLTIRHEMPRLGGLKLYYLLSSEFKKSNLKIGRDKLFRILREEDLLVKTKKKYAKTTDSRHWMRKHPNLMKDIIPTRPEQYWVADITYLETRERFYYLHLLTDAYSKKIMGYELCDNLSGESTLKALRMGISNRKYSIKIIHHSDRGLQYTSGGYISELKEAGIEVSTTQDGSPYDNAIAERVNGILKDEFGLDEVFDNYAQMVKQTKQSIEIYNKKRPHLSCSMLTPEQMHSQQNIMLKTWRKKSLSDLGI